MLWRWPDIVGLTMKGRQGVGRRMRLVGWGGGWGEWRPFIVGVERINLCTVLCAEMHGASAAARLTERVIKCMISRT